MAVKRKREKVATSKVPEVLFVTVSARDLARAIERGSLRGTGAEPLALFERRGAAKGKNGSGVMLRVAAHAAATAGSRFYRVGRKRFESTRISLDFTACSRLPRSVRNVTRIDAAGGIVVFEGKQPKVLLLLKATSKRGRWVLPKGKLQRLEARRRAARREVLEESGLVRVDVGPFLLREGYFDLEDGEVVFKQVSYYLMQCPKGKEKLKVKKSEGFLRGGWMPFSTAFARTSPVRAHRSLRKARTALRAKRS